MDINDIAELVAEHNEDLTTEDLVKLQCALEQEVKQSTLSKLYLSLAEQTGIETDRNDIAELVPEHNEDLTTEDLVKL